MSTITNELDYGVDYFGFLETVLRDLKGFRTLAHELIQNADDAPGTSKLTFDIRDDALVIENDGTFADCGAVEERDCPWLTDADKKRTCDVHRFRRIASGGKRVESDTIGAFGIGFISVYQITDKPELISAGRHWVVDAENQKIKPCNGCVECSTVGSTGTRFVLPWARNQDSLLRQRLRVEPVTNDSPELLLTELQPGIPLAMLFLKRLRQFSLCRNGKQIRTYETEVDEKNDCLIVSDGDDSTMWHLFRGNFDVDAAELRTRHAGRIEDKRRANVTIAVPDEPIDDGVFCAFLPTQYRTGLPFHINADFYPTSSRKEIVLESDYQSEWNRAAVTAAAEAVGHNVERLRGAVGHKQLWNIFQAVEQVGREAERGTKDTSLGSFWANLETSLHSSAIVYTSRKNNKWCVPRNSVYLEGKEESTATSVLNDLGFNVVHDDLRFAQNLLLNKSVGVPILKALNVAEALQARGLTSKTQPADLPGFLQGEKMAILCQEVATLLTHYQRRSKDELKPAIDELGKCAIAEARDGAFWPCGQVYRADSETIALFSTVCPSIPFLADGQNDELFDLVCPVLDAEAAIAGLQSAHDESAEEEGITFDSAELIQWFSQRIHELRLKPSLVGPLRALPIYPTSSGPRPLNVLSLPGDFTDPLGLADVVDLDALGGRREFLSELKAKELTFETYATDHVPRAFEDDTVSVEKRRRAIAMLAREHGRIEGNQGVREALQNADIVECQDNLFRKPSDVYFPTETVAEVLDGKAQLALLPKCDNLESIRSFYRWLGVAQKPRLADITDRIDALVSDPPTNESIAAIRVLFQHLGDRLGESNAERLLSPLRDKEWLPARDDRKQWYQPSELFADFQRYLFESQVDFIDVSQPIQRNTDLLKFFGINTAPETKHVVGHLLHCASEGTAVHKEIYVFLENKAEDPEIDRLVDQRCLHLPKVGQWVTAREVFWEEIPFGRFRFQLGDEYRKYNELFGRLGVRRAPDHSDALDVIESISKTFGKQISQASRELDDDARGVLSRCWEMLEHAMNEDKIDAGDLTKLEGKEVICNTANLLYRPSWMFFDDRAGLADKFAVITQNAIQRPQGAWRAMAAAGVRPLSQAVESQLVECVNPVDEASILARATDRIDQLKRVLDFHPDGVTDNLDLLSGLGFRRVDELQVQYTLKIFGKEWRAERESIHAHYLREDGVLYFVLRNGKPPWPAVARELATILCPDSEPGNIASSLKDVLAADSYEDAVSILDELGVPRLADAADGAGISSGVIDGLGDDFEVDDFTPSDVGEPEPDESETNAPLNAADAIAGILGPDATEPTPPPSELDKPEHAAGGTGSVSGGHGGTSEGNRGGTRTGGGTGGTKSKPTKRKGHARLRSYVMPDRDGAGDGDAEGHEKRSAIDQAGVARVLEFEAAQDRTPKEMPHENPGYDVESTNGSGGIERYIEIKSLSGDWGDFNAGLTDTQFSKAIELKERYWLYVVERAEQDDFQIHRIQDPASKVNQFLFDSGWQGVAEEVAGGDTPQVETGLVSRQINTGTDE
ncbi:MAG: DUF3883 domain-containing protein [Planctomycetaceae bacterium]